MSAHPIQIEQQSTSEQIANGLRDMILRGDLEPGEPIRESVLAGELGVSRNTVREAVRILDRTGLISYEMNRGARVRKPTREELEDLYTARLAIEIGAAQVAPLTEVAVELRKAFDELIAAIKKGVTEEAVRADLEFHRTAVAGAGSQRLNEAFRRTLDELQLYLAILSKAEDEYAKSDKIAAEHWEIVQAFESGKPEAAVAALTDHARTNSARLARILE